jgi:hypothetical protein
MVRADRSHKSVRELVSRVVLDPAAVVAGLGEPRRPKCKGFQFCGLDDP